MAHSEAGAWKMAGLWGALGMAVGAFLAGFAIVGWACWEDFFPDAR